VSIIAHSQSDEPAWCRYRGIFDFDELREVAERLRVEGVEVTVEAADFGLAVSPGADREDVE
jgi:hypothetical protein